MGLPLEINLFNLLKPPPDVHKVFGFPDDVLGEYVERAYQAFGIDEDRRDFVSVAFCCGFMLEVLYVILYLGSC